ncbi:MAG: hypothetical protein LBS60_13195 [Deltaproteobacteria bacterium]|jgi:hypothetical protein|nr:hypothetical protein [Deltaproteobacteria bacterium]
MKINGLLALAPLDHARNQLALEKGGLVKPFSKIEVFFKAKDVKLILVVLHRLADTLEKRAALRHCHGYFSSQNDWNLSS